MKIDDRDRCVCCSLRCQSRRAQERVIGLLSLPQVFGPRQCAPFEPEQIALHAAPNDGRPFAFIRVDQNWSFAPHGGCEGLEVSVHQGEQRHELPTLRVRLRDARRHRPRASRRMVQGAAGRAVRPGSRRRSPIASCRSTELYEEFVGVTAINRIVHRPVVERTGCHERSDHAARRAVAARARARDPRRVGSGRSVEQLRLHGGRRWAARSGRDRLAAVSRREGEPTVWFSSRGC